MEELIKQAFLHVEVIGSHVQEGHYDLIGPNEEIILPSVWEKVVEPDWAITMHMWPMDKSPLRHHPGAPKPQGYAGYGAREGRIPGMRPMWIDSQKLSPGGGPLGKPHP